MKHWKKIATFVCVVGLLAFSVYALLDAFAISRVYQVVETESLSLESGAQAEPAQIRSRKSRQGGRGESSSSGGDAELVGGATTSARSDGGMNNSVDGAGIEITTYRYAGTTVYVAEISLDDPAQLKTAFAASSYGRNVSAATSDTAASVGAVLAINGDNYGSRERGYVIRNGELYRDTAARGQEDLVIWADGSFELICEDEVTAQELLERGAQQVFSFGPGLLADGEITVGTRDEVDRAMASNPRTAVGILENGNLVFVVADGRSYESEGLSLYELASFLKGLGVQTAYNLDGGGSSTMVYQGELVNQPSSGRERAVTDIIYIG